MTIVGANTGDNLGAALAVSDVNKDSLMDIIIGAPGGDGPSEARSGAGEAYVLLGRQFSHSAVFDIAGALGPGPDVTVYGAEKGDMLGAAVASGDVNKDGFVDLIIGAPLADGPNNARPSAGEAYIILGSQLVGKTLPITIDISQGQQDVTIYGADPFDQLGISLATGEVNHDGIYDIIIGAPGADGPNEARAGAGEAYVILGRANFSSVVDIKQGQQDVTVYGADVSDGMGASVAAGQIGQDEIDDILIGAPGAEPWQRKTYRRRSLYNLR
ncbi:FG-GAP repeat protein [Candidatus Acetothermia bacterium]|nr:FG-GAP repeat protein [Candidatus Acetothermia bacterium]